LINSSTKAVVATYNYTPWGEIESSSQTVSGLNSLRWKGLLYDSETGLYYMRARYYDPIVRRFISEDPIGIAGGTNQYSFGADDPVNNVDPSGQESCRIIYGAQWTEMNPNGGLIAYAEPDRFYCPPANWFFGGWGDAFGMFKDFLFGSGPRTRSFGEGTVQVDALEGAPGVEAIRKRACEMVRNGQDPFVKGSSPFGPLGGLAGMYNQITTLGNGTLSFLGTFNVKVSNAPKGRMTFTVTNTTSFTSLSYHLLPSWERSYATTPLGTFATPLGNMRQEFTWTETNGSCFR
jgi:RHS repeat-associated protein